MSTVFEEAEIIAVEMATQALVPRLLLPKDRFAKLFTDSQASLQA